MCTLKGRMNNGGHYDEQTQWMGIMMGGHYDVEMKRWMQKGTL